MNEIFDIAVVGGGPAGLSAAINAHARNKKVIILARKSDTSALYKAVEINNHLGMPGISGREMIDKFIEHTTDLGIEIKEGRVQTVMNMGSFFSINFNNQILNAKRIILASGVQKKAGIIGEEKFIGMGVSYCASCDGMLYRKKKVIIIAESDESIDDAEFMSEICNEVLFINNKGLEVSSLNEKVNVLTNVKIKEIYGDEYAEGIITETDEMITADGIFIIRESIPAENIISGLEIVDNAIFVNRNMETNISGVFACGDCTGKPYQLSKAIGEGQIAGQGACVGI